MCVYISIVTVSRCREQWDSICAQYEKKIENGKFVLLSLTTITKTCTLSVNIMNCGQTSPKIFPSLLCSVSFSKLISHLSLLVNNDSLFHLNFLSFGFHYFRINISFTRPFVTLRDGKTHRCGKSQMAQWKHIFPSIPHSVPLISNSSSKLCR